MNKYFEAIDFAQKSHKGQYRKASKIPYIVHPLAVMETLIRNNVKDDVVIAGCLHDVVEDTDYTLDDICAKFGSRVAQLVDYASEPHKEDDWYKRKSHTVELLKTLQDRDALYIICADKYHNILSITEDYKSMGDELWKKFKQGKDKQKWYYTTIAEILLSYDKEDKLFKTYAKAVKDFFGE